LRVGCRSAAGSLAHSHPRGGLGARPHLWIALRQAGSDDGAAAAAKEPVKAVAREHPNGWTPTVKAYKSESFLTSRDARPIRVLCEYQDTQSRLRDNGIWGTILFFGSARCSTAEDHAAKAIVLEKELKAAKAADKATAQSNLTRHNKLKWVCEYMEKTTELARRITEWGHSKEAFNMVKKIMHEQIDSGDMIDPSSKYKDHAPIAPIIVATGGGPGLMEAANKGAALVPNGRSIGMGISLPFEPGLNKYVTPELAFEYHYFFTRKFWMVYPCLGLVCTPGGYGTLDELFEVLTLKQTGKIKLDVPVVLLGEKYWKSVLNFEVSAPRIAIERAHAARVAPLGHAGAPWRANFASARACCAPRCPAGVVRVRHRLRARCEPTVFHGFRRRCVQPHCEELAHRRQPRQVIAACGPRGCLPPALFIERAC